MFNLLLYLIAIVLVLTFTPAPSASADAPSDSLHLEFRATVQSLPLTLDLSPSTLTAVQAEIDASDAEDICSMFELLSIPAAPQPIAYLHCTATQLRTLGSLYQIRGASRWTKAQAIAHFANV